MCSAVQEVSLEEASEQNQDVNQKKKLYIFNLPWSFSVVDIKELFGQCGTVADVEVSSSSSSVVVLYYFWCECSLNLMEFFVLEMECVLDYKAEKWKEQGICLCDYGFTR